jgi:hypothetical protein
MVVATALGTRGKYEVLLNIGSGDALQAPYPAAALSFR